MARTRASARALTEHGEIRDWAEQRKAKPACVRGTGGGEDIGMIRLEFPGYGADESLEQISWNDWFDKFDERNLALLVQDETARGERSNFNKLVSRDTADEANGGRSSRGRSRRSKSKQNERSTQGQDFSSDADVDEEADSAEEVEIEKRPAASRRRNGSRRKTTQSRKSSRGRRGSARKSSTPHGRSRRGAQLASAKGTSRQRSRVIGRSSASQKKPAGRVRAGQRASSSGRSAGRRRAA